MASDNLRIFLAHVTAFHELSMTLMTNGDDILMTLKTNGEDALMTLTTDGEDTLATPFTTHDYLVTTPHDLWYSLSPQLRPSDEKDDNVMTRMTNDPN
jgi:hypothetical protein